MALFLSGGLITLTLALGHDIPWGVLFFLNIITA